jgi:hypothetical protein
MRHFKISQPLRPNGQNNLEFKQDNQWVVTLFGFLESKMEIARDQIKKIIAIKI